MTDVGLRELRQNASDLVRRAQAGEEITISVSGRPSAKLTPLRRPVWFTWEDLAPMYQGGSDDAWEHDRDLVDHDIQDPWSQ